MWQIYLFSNSVLIFDPLMLTGTVTANVCLQFVTKYHSTQQLAKVFKPYQIFIASLLSSAIVSDEIFNTIYLAKHCSAIGL